MRGPGRLGLMLALLAGCLPHYESGKTECSSAGLCPGGFTCLEGLCYTVAAQPGTTGLASSASAAGGCAAPLPKLCPALDERLAICTQSPIACETVVDCDGSFGGCPSATTPFDCASKHCVTGSPGQRCSLVATSPDRTPCVTCIARKCCESLVACVEDSSCADSERGPRAEALVACQEKYCSALCAAEPARSP